MNGTDAERVGAMTNGKAGVSTNMAFMPETLGWGTADHWMPMLASMSLWRPEGRADGQRTFGRAMRPLGSGMDLESVPVVAGNRPPCGLSRDRDRPGVA